MRLGVFAKTAVVRPDAGFYVGHVPGFRPQHAQDGRRIHRTGPHLYVVRLPDDTTVLGPKIEEFENHLLERLRF